MVSVMILGLVTRHAGCRRVPGGRRIAPIRQVSTISRAGGYGLKVGSLRQRFV